jgi:DNA-binding LacI/PurR family transcriptional regulator
MTTLPHKTGISMPHRTGISIQAAARHATIADVAERAGVSIATVSRVLNRTTRVSDETAARVLKAIDELGFVPQAAARHLASRKTNTIGLLLPEVSSEFFFPILRGIEAATRQAGFDLLIAIQPEDQARQMINIPLGNHNTDGLLIFGNLAASPALAQLTRLNFPVVLLYQAAPPGSGITSIQIENKHGAHQLVSHLIEVHSARRIAFLRGPQGNQDSGWREMGYRQALADHNLEFDPRLVEPGNFKEKSGRTAVETLLKKGIQFEAVFAGDDGSAIGALAALNQAGLRVPEDVAVAGFDDIPPSRYLNPPLTTVRAPTEQVGREAVKQLVRRIQTRQAGAEVLLPTELVIRQSCGCK